MTHKRHRASKRHSTIGELWIGTDFNSLTKNKRDAISAAKDLHYGDAVIAAINNATSGRQIDRILATVRHAI